MLCRCLLYTSITGCGCLFLLVLIYRLTRPIEEITDKLQAVKEGNFETKLPAYDSREFNEISEVFNAVSYTHLMLCKILLLSAAAAVLVGCGRQEEPEVTELTFIHGWGEMCIRDRFFIGEPVFIREQQPFVIRRKRPVGSRKQPYIVRKQHSVRERQEFFRFLFGEYVILRA